MKPVSLIISCATLLVAGSFANADTIHLKNGKTIEGKILQREAERIWLETDAGRVPLPLARVAVPPDDALTTARTDLEAGRHREALRLGEMVIFWQPENREAQELIERSRNALELAERGKEVSRSDSDAAATLADIQARFEQIKSSKADPPETEKSLVALESEAKDAAQSYSGSSHAQEFQDLIAMIGDSAVSAHRQQQQLEQTQEKRRALEVQRRKAEAEGISDFFAPVATLNKGGKAIDLDLLMVPDSVMIFDFYADWCGPCREMDPYLRKIAVQYDNVYLRRINIVDWGTPVVAQFDLKSIPSVWVYDTHKALVQPRLFDLQLIVAAVENARER